MDQRRSRRRSAIENDRRILDAACAAVDEVGLDAVTVSGVARYAGFTSGAMYSRYEYREELFADLWERRCAPAMRELVTRIAGYRSGPVDTATRRGLVASVFTPSAEIRVGVEMCLVAHRVPELSELLPDAFRSLLDEAGLLPIGASVDRDVDLVLLAGALGNVVLTRFAPPLLPDLERSVGLLEGPAVPPIGPPPPPMESSQRLAFERDDPIRNDLLSAAQAVLARSGVHRATLGRIGRVARLAPATVYGHYANRQELIADILRLSQVSNYDLAARLEAFGDPTAMAAALAGWLHPDGLVRRRLHAETLLAAWRDGHIGSVYVEEEVHAIEQMVSSVSPGVLAPEALRFLQRVSLLVIVGSAVLVEMVSELADLDWRPTIDLMMRNLLSPQ